MNVRFIDMNTYGSLLPGNLIQHNAYIFPKLFSL